MFFAFCFLTLVLYGQKDKSISLGKTSIAELQMRVYAKDSTADALVLEERGFTFFNPLKEVSFTKVYYARIKILTRKGFDKTDISIPFSSQSKIENIEAVTYNLSDSLTLNKTLLEKKNVYETKLDEDYNLISFAMPNVKVGSVIEFKYTYSSNGYGIYDWEFQGDIPKIKSVFKAYLPVNPKLNLRLIGYLYPSYEYSGFKKGCIDDYYCTEIKYEMENIPAFVAEEYMTSIKNYISRISFEREYFNPFARNQRINKWKSIDKNFKQVYKHELNQKREYKKILPPALFNEKSRLKRAKNVYYYIQDHFTVNENSTLKLKEVFKKKTGTSKLINLALFNALKAGGFKVEIVLLSTRENGFVTKLHPSIESFNYLIVKLKLNGNEYLLDGSDKNLPFGLLQFQSLNGEGRALDFRYGRSYWYPLTPRIKSYKNTKTLLTLKDNLISGKISIKSNGYDAKFMRDILELATVDDVVSEYENANFGLNVNDYKKSNVKNLELPLEEVLNVSIDVEGDKNIKINPFLIERLKQNPFKLKERKYPVDYGFTRSERYVFLLNIPKGYKVKSLPVNRAVKLPDNGGSVIYTIIKKENTITVLYRLYLTKKVFKAEEYSALKEFYNQLIKIQDSFIEIEKK